MLNVVEMTTIALTMSGPSSSFTSGKESDQSLLNSGSTPLLGAASDSTPIATYTNCGGRQRREWSEQVGAASYPLHEIVGEQVEYLRALCGRVMMAYRHEGEQRIHDARVQGVRHRSRTPILAEE